MTPIKCPSCGHENDLSRVFCHNCGVRLPKDAGAANPGETAPPTAAPPGSPAPAGSAFKPLKSKPIKQKKRVNWNDVAAGLIAGTVKIALLGAFIAAVILAFRMPDDLPAPAEADAKLALEADREIQNAREGFYTGYLNATERQVNEYLAAKLMLQKRNFGSLLTVKIERVFVRLLDGSFWVGVVYDIAGLRTAVQAQYQLIQRKDAKGHPIYGLVLVDAKIGRLPVPRLAMGYIESWIEPLADAMQPQLEVFAKASEVKLRDQIFSSGFNIVEKMAPQSVASNPNSIGKESGKVFSYHDEIADFLKSAKTGNSFPPEKIAKLAIINPVHFKKTLADINIQISGVVTDFYISGADGKLALLTLGNTTPRIVLRIDLNKYLNSQKQLKHTISGKLSQSKGELVLILSEVKNKNKKKSDELAYGEGSKQKMKLICYKGDQIKYKARIYNSTQSEVSFDLALEEYANIFKDENLRVIKD